MLWGFAVPVTATPLLTMQNLVGGGNNGGTGLYGTLANKGTSVAFALVVFLTGMCSASSVLVDPGAGLGRALVHAALLGLQRPWGFELDNMQ